jgi:hypothetical protein
MIFHIHALNRDDRHVHDHVFCHAMTNDPRHDTIVPILRMIMALLTEEIVL